VLSVSEQQPNDVPAIFINKVSCSCVFSSDGVVQEVMLIKAIALISATERFPHLTILKL
jgi:hypothetical protein